MYAAPLPWTPDEEQQPRRNTADRSRNVRHGPGRDRTCDLGIKSPLLYQLSYRPRSRHTAGVGKGYAEGSAVEERQAALERGDDAKAKVDPGRAAVYGSTDDAPERHFIGWADEVDVDELFDSGRAWGLQVVRKSTS